MSRYPNKINRRELGIAGLLFAMVSSLFFTSCSKSPPGSSDSGSSQPVAQTEPAVSAPKKAVAEKAPTGTNQTETATKGFATVEEVKAAKPESVPPPYHNVFVLCIGINANPAYGNLRFAVSDAEEMARLARGIYGFTNVTLLTDDGATRDGILSALARIRERLSPDSKDDFIFYFSGHGDTFTEASVKDGNTNYLRHGFLVTYNTATNDPLSFTLDMMQTNHLEMTLLASNIVQMPARHRLMFLDSCFSGLAFVKQAVVDKQPDEAYRDVIEHPTVQIMTAGLDSEQALEDSISGHGVFTDALLRQLKSTNILTMEEVFFPLRVKVRRSLEDLNKPMSMSPQHRYLIYQNGTFLFVPTSQLASWAKARSESPANSELATKGFYRPVSITEVTNLQATADGSPEKWNEQVERYEARAAMGDPYATIALAQIYGKGIGVPADERRARLYTAESSDMFTAGSMLDFAGLMGITNEVAKLLVNGLLQQHGARDVFRFRGDDLKDPVSVVKTVDEAKRVLPKLGNLFKGLFSRDPLKPIEKSYEKVVPLLTQDPITKRNLNSATKELKSMAEDIIKVADLWPAGTAPAEVGTLKKAIEEAQTHLIAGKSLDAKTAIEKGKTPIAELRKIIDAASGGN